MKKPGQCPGFSDYSLSLDCRLRRSLCAATSRPSWACSSSTGPAVETTTGSARRFGRRLAPRRTRRLVGLSSSAACSARRRSRPPSRRPARQALLGGPPRPRLAAADLPVALSSSACAARASAWPPAAPRLPRPACGSSYLAPTRSLHGFDSPAVATAAGFGRRRMRPRRPPAGGCACRRACRAGASCARPSLARVRPRRCRPAPRRCHRRDRHRRRPLRAPRPVLVRCRPRSCDRRLALMRRARDPCRRAAGGAAAACGRDC